MPGCLMDEWQIQMPDQSTSAMNLKPSWRTTVLAKRQRVVTLTEPLDEV
jgi:hypothetical protein